MGEIIFRFHQFVDNKLIKNRKVLLLGSSGALGRELDAQLKALKIPVLSASRSNFDIEGSKENILEIEEELSIKLQEINLFLSMNINANCLDNKLRTRFFYSSIINDVAKHKIHLKEGSKFKFFKQEDMPNFVEFVPFDLAALTLFYHLTIKPRVIKPTL